MKARRLRVAGERAGRAFASLRGWLRRVMPRVALAAAALFVARLLLQNTRLYDTAFGSLLRLLTLLVVCFTLAYYGLKLLVRLKRMLLWRVRRRLIITYLFVGLTPIILLLVLAFLAAIGSASQGGVRVVTVQVNATQRQTLEAARTLAAELVKPSSADAAGAGDRATQAWLDERTALLRSSLPGARVDVWRAATPGGVGQLGHDAEAQAASGAEDERTRGVGVVADTPGAPLPAWLRGHDEWSGISYLAPPENSESAFGTPSLRALARRADGGRAAAVLVTVPVSRALVERYRETTGLNVRPFFLGAEQANVRKADGDVELEGETGGEKEAHVKGRQDRVTLYKDGRKVVVDFTQDQFGETLPLWYPVFLDATNWANGARSERRAFMLDWAWEPVWKQFWSDSGLGQMWWRLLYGAAITFLVLELLALFSAAWMTRAVTGTVHKLYRATEFIKRGDFSHRIRTRSRDQLGELAVAFNDMSADIEALLADRVERERLEREIEIAHDVQAQFFPRSVPVLSAAEIIGECRAARGVSGDYYDYVEVAPGLIAFALGDVSGKGISASLVMSNLQASLRAQVAIISERLRIARLPAAAASSTAAGGGVVVAPKNADGGDAASAAAGDAMPCGVAGVDTQCAVSNMAESVNAQLCSSTEGNRFATLFLALYDDRTRTIRYTNAGHNAPALVRASGAVERLTRGGTMIGAFDWARFEEAQATLHDGDLLLVFSDGLSEAQNHAGEEYGEQRLVEFAVARRGHTVEELRRAVFEEVNQWSGGAERDDDQTLVILKTVGRA
ncbi:MAG TPA: SpoIIE family protein phosphatase [Pyrinomonadaceae bacterium]|nr:SpoIIE family protein phosphatase [Pyrinomonadaceae bacterium]